MNAKSPKSRFSRCISRTRANPNILHRDSDSLHPVHSEYEAFASVAPKKSNSVGQCIPRRLGARLRLWYFRRRDQAESDETLHEPRKYASVRLNTEKVNMLADYETRWRDEPRGLTFSHLHHSCENPTARTVDCSSKPLE